LPGLHPERGGGLAGFRAAVEFSVDFALLVKDRVSMTTMKQIGVVIGVFLIAVTGCQQPAEVDLKPEPQMSPLEVVTVRIPDTLVALGSVDTTAVLPYDQMNFFGSYVVNRVTLDGGPANVSTFAYSSVLVSDSIIRYSSREIGFYGIDLGVVTLNGNLMAEVPHRIRLRRLSLADTVLVRGVEYLADLSQTFTPNQQYTWISTSLQYGRVDVSINSPDDLRVLSPVGGSVIVRDRDLPLRWTGGNGTLKIILSAYDRFSRRTFPLLEFRPQLNTGRALIPSTLLRQLPQKGTFVFTFILSNRKEISSVHSKVGRVLVQAASVYNSYIELR
jgi:hypothetical protein